MKEKLKGKQSLNITENEIESNGLGKQKTRTSTITHKNMKVGHWFLSRFALSDAYQSLCKEFNKLEYITNNWLSPICPNNHNTFTFIQHPISVNTSRTLKVNAQRVIRQDGKIYIACKGPNLVTVYDFWTLVWQENVKTIMSMNYPYEERLYPNAYQKNHETIQYWPIVNGKTYNFMPFKITCINSSLMADCEIRTDDNSEYVYRLTQLRIRYCNSIYPKKDRFLTHVCYFRWPDGQLPLPWGRYNTLAKAADILLQILVMVNDDITLIHCHAGRGRTGVLLALDFAMHQLKNLQTVNVEALIEKIRQQRPGAVMNRWQYAYINIVIAEQAYRMGYLLHRTNGRYITRQLINKLWINLENDMKKNFEYQIISSALEEK
ncbi:Protein-tyrosine phosphatase family protein [Acanthocheilonema viteae]